MEVEAEDVFPGGVRGQAGGVVGLIGGSGPVVVGVVEAVTRVRERREALVEGDVDQAAVAERLGLLDQRDVVLEEQVRGVQPTRVVGRRDGLGVDTGVGVRSP